MKRERKVMLHEVNLPKSIPCQHQSMFAVWKSKINVLDLNLANLIRLRRAKFHMETKWNALTWSRLFHPSKNSCTYRRLSSIIRNPVMLIAPNSLISDSHRSSITCFVAINHNNSIKCHCKSKTLHINRLPELASICESAKRPHNVFLCAFAEERERDRANECVSFFLFFYSENRK